MGDFHIAKENRFERLNPLKNLGVDELIFLSTCNRVEFLIRTQRAMNVDFLNKLFKIVYPYLSDEKHSLAVQNASTFSNVDAVEHWFRVASSLDSLVIGEREILGQMREAYQLCKDLKLNSDFMRILMRKTVETGKLIYTETEISNHPISVVNLALKKLESIIDIKDSRVLAIGAGKTNTALIKKLKKNGCKDFTIYNRTLANAELLAESCSGSAYPLSELGKRTHKYDVLITCTGSETTVIEKDTYESFTYDSDEPKAIIDLAVPNDVSLEVRKGFPMDYISVDGLRDIAAENLKKRKTHLAYCEEIIEQQVSQFESVYKERQVEIAMRVVPEQVKEIKRKAIEEVFAKDVEQMDTTSKEVLDKVVQYLEKKYMSKSMLMAKEILLKENVR